MTVARTLSIALGLSVSGCAATYPLAGAPRALEESTPAGAVVTITRVKPPWYATRGLIISGFKRSLPEYQAARGLARKSYTIAEADGFFGGLYLWTSQADADAWFSPAWFERVQQRYGVAGEVRTFAVSRMLAGPAGPVEEGDMLVAIAPGTLEPYRDAKGLRSAFETDGQVISVWVDRSAGATFLARFPKAELFRSPLALVNPASGG